MKRRRTVRMKSNSRVTINNYVTAFTRFGCNTSLTDGEDAALSYHYSVSLDVFFSALRQLGVENEFGVGSYNRTITLRLTHSTTPDLAAATPARTLNPDACSHLLLCSKSVIAPRDGYVLVSEISYLGRAWEGNSARNSPIDCTFFFKYR